MLVHRQRERRRGWPGEPPVPRLSSLGCVTVQDEIAQSAFYLHQGVMAQVSGRMRRAHMRQLSRLREPGTGERPMLLFPEVLTVSAAYTF